jgi:hypothetical protein
VTSRPELRVAPPAELAAIETYLSDVFQRFVPALGDAAVEARCQEIVSGNARMSPAEQVDVYREQFWLRHRDSLTEDYPALKHVLGEEPFEDFLRAFLKAHPPRTPSLRDIGADILAFAESYDFAGELRELALDCLRYELAFIEAFDGPDPDPLDAAVIAAVPAEAWNHAVIVMNPCVGRLRLRHAVHHLRFALKAEETPPATPRIEGGVRVALFRQANVVRFEELPSDAFDLLESLASGLPLVPACARLTESRSDEDVARIQGSIGGWFAGWARAGFFARIDLDSPGATP